MGVYPNVKSRPIETHPDFEQYIRRDTCQETLNSKIRSERQKLLNKYACYDGAIYRKGSCDPVKTVADFDIKTHPDFPKYVARSDVSEALSRQVKKISNRPIEQHPDYPKLRKFFANLLQEKTSQLKTELANQPIDQHRDYKRLMDTYACSEGNCESKRYIPCPSCMKPKAKLSDFAITDHPDIDKYILKEEAKQVSRQLISKIKNQYGYQPCTKESEPEKGTQESQKENNKNEMSQPKSNKTQPQIEAQKENNKNEMSQPKSDKTQPQIEAPKNVELNELKNSVQELKKMYGEITNSNKCREKITPVRPLYMREGQYVANDQGPLVNWGAPI